MRIVADKTTCAGTAMCVSVAPTHFALDETDQCVSVLDDTPTPQDIDDVEEAVELCPTQSLRLVSRPGTGTAPATE